MNDIDLIGGPLIWLAALTAVGAVVVAQIMRGKGPSLENLVREHGIPPGTSGYVSGQTVFSQTYVFLGDEELVQVSGRDHKRVHRVRYDSISDISLGGWTFLNLRISGAGRAMRVAPISRLTTYEGGVAIALDTVEDYRLRYMALFQHFVAELRTRGVDDALTSTVPWRFAQFRRVLAAIVVTILIFVVIIAFVSEGAAFSWLFEGGLTF